jgi:lipoprotein-anchoring transpeptidase ErfK/SrfK
MRKHLRLRQFSTGLLTLAWFGSDLAAQSNAHTAPQAVNQRSAQAGRLDIIVVNAAGTAPTLAEGDTGSAALRAQVLLDRMGLSVGEIDGRIGKNTFRAVSGLRAARGWAESDRIDEPIWMVLNMDSAPALVTYEITAGDVKGPFVKVPQDMMAKAKRSHLGYASALEGLGEKFHCSPSILKALNPKSRFLRSGEKITVPNVRSPVTVKAAQIVVSKAASTLVVLDGNGKLIVQYPCTSGSEHDPLPLGEWTVTGVLKNPPFNYNPDLFWDANPRHSKARIPPGPNNPVGVVWIDLSKENYGIHGTPEPSTIGYAESHGCIRLTNWDAAELGGLVKKGLPVLLKD